MSKKPNDGGTAYPRPYSKDDWQDEHIYAQDCMTLRDHFAASVDVNQYTPFQTLKAENGKIPTIAEVAEYIAKVRYMEADAMLLAREVKNEQ